MQTDATMMGVVAFALAVMCKRMQQLPILLGPAVHRVETLETMCNERERPQQCWGSCVNGSNIVALRFGDHGTKECWELLAQNFDRFRTLCNNSQQHATTCNRVCKRTQHATSNNVGSCWPTMLRPFARGFRIRIT